MEGTLPLPSATTRQGLSSRKQCEADHSKAPQCNVKPHQAQDPDLDHTTIHHSSAFSFPTLSPDGSIEDISAPSLTPPAALSSLGRRLNMVGRGNMADSSSSLADSQYDMIDDLSEISNDDHETASLASTERNASDDGIMTPDDEESLVTEEQQNPQHTADDDLSDAMSIDEEDEPVVERNIADSLDGLHGPRAQAALDSFLSEDLETPRQSTLGEPFRMPTSHTSRTSTTAPAGRSYNLLFICDRGVPESEIDTVCRNVTSSIAGFDDTSACRTFKLPITPSGISPSSTRYFRDGDVQLSVQQCIKVEQPVDSTAPGGQLPKFNLHLLGVDRELSSVRVINGFYELGVDTPDLAVLYKTSRKEQPAWFETSSDAMRVFGVPVMTVTGRAGRLRASPTDCSLDDLAAMRIALDFHLHTKLHNRGRPVVPKISAPAKKAKAASASLRVMWPAFLAFAVLILSSFTGRSLSDMYWGTTDVTHIRREGLQLALEKLTNSTNANTTFNIDHLVPSMPNISLSKETFRPQDYFHYDSAPPNHIVVSLPKQPGSWYYAWPENVAVSKNERAVSYHQTKLIDGIYHLAIDPNEAYGHITIKMLLRNPNFHGRIEHYFGNRMLQRSTYQKAGTELSKSVTKDLTVAREAAKSLGEKLSLELSAGAMATKNITTQVALYVARDMQRFVKSTGSAFEKVAKAGTHTGALIRKDLILMRDDLKQLSRKMQDSFTASRKAAKSLVPTKKIIGPPLQLARTRALDLQKKLLGKKDANSTTTTKALSRSVRTMLGSSSDAGQKVQDFVHCVRQKGFRGCSKEQKRSLSTRGNSLSTVAGKGLSSQKSTAKKDKKTSARDATARLKVKQDRALKHAEDELERLSKQKQKMQVDEAVLSKQREMMDQMTRKAEDRAAKLARG